MASEFGAAHRPRSIWRTRPSASKVGKPTGVYPMAFSMAQAVRAVRRVENSDYETQGTSQPWKEVLRVWANRTCLGSTPQSATTTPNRDGTRRHGVSRLDTGHADRRDIRPAADPGRRCYYQLTNHVAPGRARKAR